MKTLPRIVLPEVLDRLAPDDPRALQIRRDLQFFNGVLPNARVMARILDQHFPGKPPDVLLDLGAGDGTFMLRLAQRLAPRWRGVTLMLLDQQDSVEPQTREAFARLGWQVEIVTSDVFAFLRQRNDPRSTAVIANLFLHHFDDAPLQQLLAHIAASASVFVACEPRRVKVALRICNLLWMLGCDDLTCHDTAASHLAGFRPGNLTQLWPEGGRWDLKEHTAALFTHCFVARRIGA